jgi:hypothetical protein
MADSSGRPIHGAPTVVAAAVAPAGERCLGCGDASHVGTRCASLEVRTLRRRVRELEAELMAIRAEVAADRARGLALCALARRT